MSLPKVMQAVVLPVRLVITLVSKKTSDAQTDLQAYRNTVAEANKILQQAKFTKKKYAA
jgi:hypothetical protein